MQNTRGLKLTVSIGNDDKFPKLPDGSRDMIRSHNHVDTWKQMEAVLETGKTKAIGVSNVSRTTPSTIRRDHAKLAIVQQEIP